MVDLHIVVSRVGWVVWRRPTSSTGWDQAGAHTLEPTYQSELLGSGSRAWLLSSQAWVTPTHLIIHNTVSFFFYTFPSPIPQEKEVYTDWACCCVVKCQQRSFSELGCSFVEDPAAHVRKEAGADIADLYQCSGGGDPTTPVHNYLSPEQNVKECPTNTVPGVSIGHLWHVIIDIEGNSSKDKTANYFSYW